jgi:DNA-directed RNA polymerase subunit RPC12/RpoP
MKKGLQINCPHCTEIAEYHLPQNFEGKLKCLKCNQLFWVRIQKMELTDVATREKE